jgi:hypothetical protein
VLLSTTLGILTLLVGEESRSILAGVLIISFASAAVGAAAPVAVVVSRRARTSRLRADLRAIRSALCARIA